MERKSSYLPSIVTKNLNNDRSRDKHKLQQFFKRCSNRNTPTNSQVDLELKKVKATNFLSRMNTLDSPSIIFAVSDQIREIQAQNSDNLRQNIHHNYRSTYHPGLQNKKSSEQRQNAINLAKWMDEKLSIFRAKSFITFSDIIEYKQTILNYSLGKIIDSLTKKCKQQGQLLSLIWNNTFVMFQGVFDILVSAAQQKEAQKHKQATQLHELFEVNHNFLREENKKLSAENVEIFQKMKNVIDYNKRLRRERKKFSISNKVLQYRNYTYTQCIEQLIEMILCSCSQPAALQLAKKIIFKLSKNRNKKKVFYKVEADEQIKVSSKEMVYNWLKNNTYLADEALEYFKESNFTKQDGFMFSDLDDKNQINKVDVFDFFKLFDVGVQATPEVVNFQMQSQEKTIKSTEIQTISETKVENGCQTAKHTENLIENIQVLNSGGVLHANDINKDQKNIKKLKSNKESKQFKGKLMSNKAKQKNSNLKSTFRGDNQNNQHDQKLKSYQIKRGSLNRKDTTVTYESAFFEKFSKEDNQSRNSRDDQIDIDQISNANTKNISQKAMFSLLSQQAQQYQAGSFQILGQSGIKKEKQISSLAYIKSQHQLEEPVRLQKKNFSEAYRENKLAMEKNKVQFVERIMKRRSLYIKKKIDYGNFQQAAAATQHDRQAFQGKSVRIIQRSQYGKSDFVSENIEQMSKKISNNSNIAKAKALVHAQGNFQLIVSSIQHFARIPSKNKVYVNNTLTMITKFIEGLFPDYLKQIRREREELTVDFQKSLYPLQILVMERMNFKYGLKDISGKKLKDFIEKIMTYESISQKVSLYSLLLGLEDEEVGSDELLVYLKCQVYFQTRKSRESSQSSVVEISIVRQNLQKVLQYFFDTEYINLLSIKLQVYFQQTAPFTTIQGISIIIIRELLKRKKQLRHKYAKIHELCSFGASFFTNMFKLLKIVNNYREQASNDYQLILKHHIDGAKSKRNSLVIKNRCNKHEKMTLACSYDHFKLASIINEIFKRSDIIDEQHGKSITLDRFLPVAFLNSVPTYEDTSIILEFLSKKFTAFILNSNPHIAQFSASSFKCIELLNDSWNRSEIKRSDSVQSNTWSFAKLITDRVEEQMMQVMGKVGQFGMHIQGCIFNLSGKR